MARKTKEAAVQTVLINRAENGFAVTVNREGNQYSSGVYDPGKVFVAVDVFDLTSILYDLFGYGEVE